MRVTFIQQAFTTSTSSVTEKIGGVQAYALFSHQYNDGRQTAETGLETDSQRFLTSMALALLAVDAAFYFFWPFTTVQAHTCPEQVLGFQQLI
jgi:hypothetical protein